MKQKQLKNSVSFDDDTRFNCATSAMINCTLPPAEAGPAEKGLVILVGARHHLRPSQVEVGCQHHKVARFAVA